MFLVCMPGLHIRATHIQYTQKDSLCVVALLTDAMQQTPATNFPLYFARQFIGTPYVAATLEKNEEEQLVVNLSQLDCTTFVENVLALTLCVQKGTTRFEDFCTYLRKIRYQQGIIAYSKRLHYFSDWILDNEEQGFVEELQIPTPPFSALQILQLHFMSSNAHLYPMLVKHPQWINDIRQREKELSHQTYKYIPKHAIANTALLRNTIKNGDILSLLTTRKGLDTSHIGIAVWHKDGLHLLNASKIRGKVVEESMTLYRYMQTQRNQIGIRVIRIL